MTKRQIQIIVKRIQHSDNKVERASLYMQLWQEMGYKYQPSISEH